MICSRGFFSDARMTPAATGRPVAMLEELHTAMGPPLPSSPSAAVPLARLAHPGMLVQCRRGYREREAVGVNPVFLRRSTMHRISSTETARLMVRKDDPPPVRQALRPGRPIGPGNGDLLASLSDRSKVTTNQAPGRGRTARLRRRTTPADE